MIFNRFTVVLFAVSQRSANLISYRAVFCDLKHCDDDVVVI